MSTAMSIALAKVGLITEKQANDVVVLPRHLVPYQEQIEEISRLAGLMKANRVKESGMDVVVYLALSADLSAGRHEEGYRLALSHLQKRVIELGLV